MSESKLDERPCDSVKAQLAIAIQALADIQGYHGWPPSPQEIASRAMAEIRNARASARPEVVIYGIPLSESEVEKLRHSVEAKIAIGESLAGLAGLTVPADTDLLALREMLERGKK
jgi:hypothetical protein